MQASDGLSRGSELQGGLSCLCELKRPPQEVLGKMEDSQVGLFFSFLLIGILQSSDVGTLV